MAVSKLSMEKTMAGMKSRVNGLPNVVCRGRRLAVKAGPFSRHTAHTTDSCGAFTLGYTWK